MMERQKIIGMVNAYSKRTRDQIMTIFTNFINRAGISERSSEIFSCIDELIKNAVKANYKFVLILDKLHEEIKLKNPELADQEIEQQIIEIIKDKDGYDKIAERISKEHKISAKVRTILNEESKQLKLKNKIYDEKRDYAEDEKKILQGLDNLNMIRNSLEKRDVKVIIKIELENDFLFIEVTNTAPIMAEDMKRIHTKRDEFKTYLGTGREYEFFMNNLDTTESGFGLGYATIDSFLYGIGLDPYQAIQLLAASDTTIILSIPLSQVKSDLAS